MEQNAKKKISCGGFMLGEGLVLSEDGKTLSVSGGGGSVPKPLTYDYMPEGYPTKSVQTTTLMEEQEFAFDTINGTVYAGEPTNQLEIVVGQTYTVKWDGTEYECVGIDKDMYVIGNLSIAGIGDDTGEPFVYRYDARHALGAFFTLDTSASHTISVKTTAETVTPMAEEYLPDTVATKSEVESVQITASSNKELIYDVLGSTVTVTFDKQTSGRDTFKFNDFNYYKISDFNPSSSDVIAFTGTRENGNEFSEVTIGENCVEYGLFIVVASTGYCTIAINGDTKGFTSPSAGLYACYSENSTASTAGTGEFTLRSSTGSLSIAGLLLKSSTSGSTKKYKITVDDSGTLKATEI